MIHYNRIYIIGLTEINNKMIDTFYIKAWDARGNMVIKITSGSGIRSGISS